MGMLHSSTTGTGRAPRAGIGAIALGLGFVVLAGTTVARAAAVQEPAIAGTGKDADYLRSVHARIHPNWVEGYLRMSPYSALGPVTSEREVTVRVAVRWDGTIEAANVEKRSDSADFDAAALNAVLVSAPFPPPVEVLGDDGLAHLRWRMARDFRLCSQGEVVRVEFPIQMALPNLTARGMLEEAVRRMHDQLGRQGWSGGDFLTPFARQWLTRPNLSTDLDTRAAAALALGGDRKQSAILEKSLNLTQVSPIAAVALDRLGADLGALLDRVATSDPASSRTRAMVAAIRAVPTAASRCAGCLEGLVAALRDPRQPAGVRAQMIEILGRFEPRPEAVAAALSQALADPAPLVRGAAMLANLPAGHTHVGVLRMAALLHDPAPEIRAAAAAGVLRAGGEAGLEQLYLLGRDKDARPLMAAAAELGHMSSEDSAAFLGRLLKRPEKNVRLAVVRALAARSDAAARKLVEPILARARANAAEDPAIREMVITVATPDELASMAADPRLGQAVYRAWLRNNDRASAARWLLDNLVELSPEDRIAVLGDWIAVTPAYAARK
jgi:TonB family protein